MGRRLIYWVIFSIALTLILNDVNVHAPVRGSITFKYVNDLQTNMNNINRIGKTDFARHAIVSVFNAKSGPAVACSGQCNLPNITGNTTSPCFTGRKTKSYLPADNNLLTRGTPLRAPIT
jgi:hypothetical protein